MGRVYNRNSPIDWDNLAILAPKHTVIEIAGIKNCSQQAVRRALSIKGLISKGVHRGPHKQTIIIPPPMPEIRIMCKGCGKRLTVVPWNKKAYMAYCDNFRCRYFHNPVMHPKLKISGGSYA